MQNCKSIVAIVFECYFFNQPLHCNVRRYGIMMSVLQDVEGLQTNYTFQEEDQFPCTISGSIFTCFDLGMASIIM